MTATGEAGAVTVSGPWPVGGDAGLRFAWRPRLRAFADAGRGLVGFFRDQAHAWIHLAASAIAIGLGAWLGLSPQQWCWIVVALALVWVSELWNTALEVLADAVHPGEHPGVGRAKDTAAAAVLVAALAAAALGGLVLGPPLWERLAP